jgi:hypothetical protein
MSTDLLQQAPADGQRQPHTGQRRLVKGAVAVLVLVVVCIATVGIAILASTPRLAPGSFIESSSTTRLVTDDLDGSTVVIDGTRGGVLHVSVRNPSRFTITILGLVSTPETPSSLRSVSFESDPYGLSKDLRLRRKLVNQVTLGSGQEAGVFIQVRLPDCLPYEKGASAIYDRVPLLVRRFGRTQSVMMPLEIPLWVSAKTAHPVSGPCPR